MSDRNDNGRWVLPEGWRSAKVRDVATLIRGVTYEKSFASDVPSEGLLPVLRATNIQDERLILDRDLVYVPKHFISTEQQLQKNDVVICTSSGSKHLVGKAARLTAEWDGSFGAFCAGIRFDPEIDPRYGAYFFGSQEYRNLIREKSSGVNINNLRRSDIEELDFPIPPPEEQKHIADEIEKQFTRLDAAVAALRRAKANLARYKAAVLKAAVEGRLVTARPQRSSETSEVSESASDLLARILAERRAQWEAANPKKPYIEPKGPDVAGLPGLPVGWVWATVEQVGDANEQPVLTGPFGSSLGSNDFIPQGVPLLTIGCLKESGITLDKAFYVSEEKANELERYRVREGDILFSRMAAVGRAGFVTASLEGSLINYHLMRLRLNIKAIDPDFFIYYVRGSKAVEAYIREVNHGVTRDGINTSQLLALPVALPPYSEQRVVVEEIERLLSVVHASERVIDANLARADRLRQGVLGKAFRGELVANGETSEVF